MIDIEHPVPYVYTHNGLAESLIKRLQVIARTFFFTKLITYFDIGTCYFACWGIDSLEAYCLTAIFPIAIGIGTSTRYIPFTHIWLHSASVNSTLTTHQNGTPTSIGNICGIWLTIYYQISRTTDEWCIYHTIVDCHFDETNFSRLGERKNIYEVRRDPQWKVTHLSYLDPRTS